MTVSIDLGSAATIFDRAIKQLRDLHVETQEERDVLVEKIRALEKKKAMLYADMLLDDNTKFV